jgi:hypothetical protein
MHPWLLLRLVVLLALANGAPVIAKVLWGGRHARPIDHGLRWFDRRPLFGASKTDRGVVTAIAASLGGSLILGMDWRIGLTVGVAAMAGDLFSSFVKRRLGFPLHGRATGLDQIPESLLPLLSCGPALGLTAADIASGVVAFVLGEIVLSRWLYAHKLRDRPY